MVDVRKAIQQLKRGKHDSYYKLYSDHYVHTTHRFHVLLTLLFNLMLNHNVIPYDISQSVLIPIPKDKKKSLNTSKNYRAIALSSVMGKIIDLCLLSKHTELFTTNDLQFGFKKDHSSMQCTFAVKEVIQYYNNKRSNVHVMLLDASQAFDRVSYSVLLLLRKGLCPVTIQFLLHLYTHQQMSVRWMSYESPQFSVQNGVRQGGVLPPMLFAIYIDELFQLYMRHRIGCYIGHTFTGAFGYTDDILLLAPTHWNSLDRMLCFTNEFATQRDIKFNSTKCKYMIFSWAKEESNSVIFNETTIKSSKQEKHL